MDSRVDPRCHPCGNEGAFSGTFGTGQFIKEMQQRLQAANMTMARVHRMDRCHSQSPPDRDRNEFINQIAERTAEQIRCENRTLKREINTLKSTIQDVLDQQERDGVEFNAALQRAEKLTEENVELRTSICDSQRVAIEADSKSAQDVQREKQILLERDSLKRELERKQAQDLQVANQFREERSAWEREVSGLKECLQDLQCKQVAMTNECKAEMNRACEETEALKQDLQAAHQREDQVTKQLCSENETWKREAHTLKQQAEQMNEEFHTRHEEMKEELKASQERERRISRQCSTLKQTLEEEVESLQKTIQKARNQQARDCMELKKAICKTDELEQENVCLRSRLKGQCVENKALKQELRNAQAREDESGQTAIQLRCDCESLSRNLKAAQAKEEHITRHYQSENQKLKQENDNLKCDIKSVLAESAASRKIGEKRLNLQRDLYEKSSAVAADLDNIRIRKQSAGKNERQLHSLQDLRGVIDSVAAQPGDDINQESLKKMLQELRAETDTKLKALSTEEPDENASTAISGMNDLDEDLVTKFKELNDLTECLSRKAGGLENLLGVMTDYGIKSVVQVQQLLTSVTAKDNEEGAQSLQELIEIFKNVKACRGGGGERKADLENPITECEAECSSINELTGVLTQLRVAFGPNSDQSTSRQESSYPSTSAQESSPESASPLDSSSQDKGTRGSSARQSSARGSSAREPSTRQSSARESTVRQSESRDEPNLMHMLTPAVPFNLV